MVLKINNDIPHDKQEYIAWLFPNSKNATRKKIEQYRISLEDLKKVLGLMKT